ncbi:hypothetical protein [Cohnella lubricantis]|uniref:Uncharacterized protein n=1 Tax=Cohnella lubricantis TaxID=2163172 RepID=A0A841TMJ9_9BACL|nr:hypothetical protein [Cohnella lubricantis]MBB6679741.1 hypothetical protein [Cohnella lubricantis]MBP2119467.1 hypothetical protein [Cohnella lubricantis]
MIRENGTRFSQTFVDNVDKTVEKSENSTSDLKKACPPGPNDKGCSFSIGEPQRASCV